MLNNKYFKLTNECRLCKSKNLMSFVDFGSVALGNNLQDSKENALNANEYPLEIFRCLNCNHFQLSGKVDPEDLYATNYTYLSGIGSSFVTHIKKYVSWIEGKTNLLKNSVVVEIGSNDGSCLEVFKKKGYKVCGVDPASLAAKIANDKGVFTINNFFNDDVVNTIVNKFGSADIVTSQNVLAHVDDLRGTFQNIYYLLKKNGFFVFEIGYFKEVLRSGCFDTIYHEHIDYHHGSPLANYLCSIGFDLIHIETNEIQGGSLRLLLQKTGNGIVSNQAQIFLKEEKKSIIYDDNFLVSWSASIFKMASKLNMIIKEEKKGNVQCFAYGSPTKAVLLLKTSLLKDIDIDFIVEDNTYKVGKYIPSSGIPIYSTNDIDFNKSVVILILAWNFCDDIVLKLKKLYNVPVKIIVPLPKLKVFDL